MVGHSRARNISKSILHHASTAVIETLETRSLLSAGSMDPTFGGTGNVAVDFGAPYTVSLATKETLQLDGKVIVVGMASRGTFSNPTGEDFALARFNPDGTRDASFGTLGQTTVDVS